MPSTAVILIDHGSRQEEAASALSLIAGLVAQKLGLPVHVAHLSAAVGTMDEAIRRAIDQGARKIIVCPYLLAEGTHSRVEIPALVAAAAKRFGRVAFELTPPLGPDPLLAELVAKRVRPLLDPGEAL